MPHPFKPDILRIIAIAKASLPIHDERVLENYSSLRAAIIDQELDDEVTVLSAMLEREGFDSAFKAHCRIRALKNADSCLSFTAMPNGACNKMYWEIANKLLHPVAATMQTMLAILLPDIKRYVRQAVSVADTSHRLDSSNIKFTLEDTPLSDLGASKLNTLSRYVIANDTLLDVQDMSAFDFRTHRRYKTMLVASAPELAKRLYQHNPALRQLFEHLSLLDEKVRTPFEVLSSLTQALRIGGSAMTHATYASDGAEKAFEAFQDYMRFLPSETRDALLLLSGGQYSLAFVIRHLENRECVEIAARMLQSILDAERNQIILNTHPTLSTACLSGIQKNYRGQLRCPVEILFKEPTERDIDAIINKYKIVLVLKEGTLQLHYCNDHGEYQQHTINYEALLREREKIIQLPRDLFHIQSLLLSLGTMGYQSLPTSAMESTIALPTAGLEKAVRMIQLSTADDYFNLLINFPPTLYAVVMSHATLASTALPMALCPRIKQDILNKEQKDAFFRAILDCDAFSVRDVIYFIIECGISPSDLSSFVSGTILHAFVKDKDILGNTLLRRTAISNSDSFLTILELLPEADRLGTLKEKNTSEHTVLQDMDLSSQISLKILKLLPEADRLRLMKETTKTGFMIFEPYLSSETDPSYLRELLTQVSNPLEKIKWMTTIAQLKYERWFNGSRFRGANGFFTFMRHGTFGQQRAKALEQTIFNAPDINVATQDIRHFLLNRGTRYHQHSFATFLLDEINTMGEIRTIININALWAPFQSTSEYENSGTWSSPSMT